MITVKLILTEMLCYKYFFKIYILFFVEADDHGHAHLDREMQGSMRLFRAQRNFYISGFSLFLALVRPLLCLNLN